MVTNVIQIGEDLGIMLPSGFLDRLGLSVDSPVSIFLHGSNILIKSNPFRSRGEGAVYSLSDAMDELLLSCISEDEPFEVWRY